jgi:hypothetical protein
MTAGVDPLQAQQRDAEREAEANAGASRLGRPSLNMLADVPLADDDRDRLGFPAYADALAGLLDHPDTDTPLTIAISAPWGAGKTSLANMVTRRLVDRPVQRGDRPHIICLFNAWLHDDAPHLGAAFAAEVAKTANQYRAWPRRLLSPLPSALLSPEERWRRRIFLGLGSVSVALLLALMPSIREVVRPEATTIEALRAVAGQRWTSLIVIALVALAVWRKLFAAAQAAARFVDDPKSEAATGSMWQVRNQLGRLIREATRNPGRFGTWLKNTFPLVARFVPRYRTERRRLVLVVDDLERCRPPRAVEVCEVASQLLAHPDVATILVADMSTVATSAEIKYAALEGVSGKDGGADSGASALPKGNYGRLYLQKMVQIQFNLPPPSHESLRGMLTKMPDALPGPSGERSRRHRWYGVAAYLLSILIAIALSEAVLLIFNVTPPFPGVILAVTEWLQTHFLSVGAVSVLASVGGTLASYLGWRGARQRTERIDEEIKTRTEKAELSTVSGDHVEAVRAGVMESEAAKQGGSGLASQRLERFLTDESMLRENAESKILEFLPTMPLNAKRLINHLRLLLVVASERRMLGGIPPMEAAHLGKWVVLLERWPEIGWAVHADPAALVHLEEAVEISDRGAALEGIVRTVAPQVVVSPDLTAFLKDEPRLAPVVERLIYCLPAAVTTIE